MANKTLRLLVQANSNDSTNVSVDVNINGTSSTHVLNHTAPWNPSDDETGAVAIDLTVDTPESGDNAPTANVSLTPTGGSILVVGHLEDCTATSESNPNYDSNDPNSEEYIFSPGSVGTFEHTVDIVAQPTINGEVDLSRYDFSGHYGGGLGGGDLGPGNLPIEDGETGAMKLQYSYYSA